MDSRARARVERGARRDAERGRGDMDADADRPAGQLRDRERVVDLGGRGVVDAEGLGLGEGQVGRGSGRRQVRECDAPGEVLREKSPEMIIVRRRQRPAALEEARRRRLEALAGLLEGLPFDALAVGIVEQPRLERRELGRQFPLHQLRDVEVAQLGLAALALDRGERRLQRLRGRGPVAAAALLVEIHRRAVELHEQRGRLDRLRRAPVVLARQPLEAEFLLPAALPEKIRVDVRGEPAGVLHEAREAAAVEAEQHRGSLHLRALAVRRLDLQRSVVVGQDGADLEAALLLVEDALGLQRTVLRMMTTLSNTRFTDQIQRAPWNSSG